MLDTSVKYSESTQLGAPVLSSSPETREKMRAGMIGLKRSGEAQTGCDEAAGA